MASDRVDALDIFDAIATEVSIRFKPVPHGVFRLDASRFAKQFRIWRRNSARRLCYAK